MARHKLSTVATILSAVMAASLLTATPANAISSDADNVVGILRALPSETLSLEDVDTSGVTDLVAPGGTSTAAAAIADVSEVSVSTQGEDPLVVELVAAQNAVAVSVSHDGVEVIDNGDGSSTVPLVR